MSTTIASHSESESLESLRQRAATLRAHLAHLQSSHPAPAAPPAVPTTYSTQALPIRPLPTHSSSSSSRLAATLPNSDSHSPSAQLQSTLELARKWRITGRSVFLIELARGMRANREMLATEREVGRGKSKGKGRERDEGAEGEGEREFVKKGVVVRLETFYEGRYFEPFYLVFAPAEPSSADSHPVDASVPLQIVHHSIPHWLPLKELSQKYLGLGIRGDADDDEASAEGSSSLKSKVQPDLDLFLTRLTVYLNAFISRREQLLALRTTYSRSSFASHDFRIFASEAQDRIIAEWDLSSLEAEGEEEDGEQRTVVVQMAFLDLRGTGLVQSNAGRDVVGGSLLVRYVERQGVNGAAPQQKAVVLEELCARVLKGTKERSMVEVVTALMQETTAAGWEPESDE